MTPNVTSDTPNLLDPTNPHPDEAALPPAVLEEGGDPPAATAEGDGPTAEPEEDPSPPADAAEEFTNPEAPEGPGPENIAHSEPEMGASGPDPAPEADPHARKDWAPGMRYFRSRVDGVVCGKLVTVNEVLPLSAEELAGLSPGSVEPIPPADWPANREA